MALIILNDNVIAWPDSSVAVIGILTSWKESRPFPLVVVIVVLPRTVLPAFAVTVAPKPDAVIFIL